MTSTSLGGIHSCSWVIHSTMARRGPAAVPGLQNAEEPIPGHYHIANSRSLFSSHPDELPFLSCSRLSNCSTNAILQRMMILPATTGSKNINFPRLCPPFQHGFQPGGARWAQLSGRRVKEKTPACWAPRSLAVQWPGQVSPTCRAAARRPIWRRWPAVLACAAASKTAAEHVLRLVRSWTDKLCSLDSGTPRHTCARSAISMAAARARCWMRRPHCRTFTSCLFLPNWSGGDAAQS